MMAGKWNEFTIKSYIKDIEKEIQQAEREKLKKAAQHVHKKIRDKIKHRRISQPGEPPGRYSGNLYKGIGYSVGKDEAIVGTKPPANHAHLLEFGTEQRTVKKTGKDAGKVVARPFLLPTFDEEKETVKNILSEKWVD